MVNRGCSPVRGCLVWSLVAKPQHKVAMGPRVIPKDLLRGEAAWGWKLLSVNSRFQHPTQQWPMSECRAWVQRTSGGSLGRTACVCMGTGLTAVTGWHGAAGSGAVRTAMSRPTPAPAGIPTSCSSVSLFPSELSPLLCPSVEALGELGHWGSYQAPTLPLSCPEHA